VKLSYYLAPPSSSRRREETEAAQLNFSAVKQTRCRYVPYERSLNDEQEREAHEHRSLYKRYVSFAQPGSHWKLETVVAAGPQTG
jgi:hypothetical protein